ncbi:hypothetical protein [Bradyrhizobium sp. CCGE-LA001]|uniref:hypothetical protein n=1 Tax=Bradyrhizobium sp. CCGE-LA001 TaxID=1223566 RepID=UPI001F270D26|nr:hypothetical protein [Bradyrhizobium sp. CCGE-LA001]
MSRRSISSAASAENDSRGLADDLAARHADHLLGGDEDVAQIARILGDDAFGDILDDGREEALHPLQDALAVALLGDRQPIRFRPFVNRGPLAT